MKTYNKTNFHKYTFCIFKEVDFHEIKELKCDYKSKSGSSYYFTEIGIYRFSNHWGRAANCKWRLVPKSVTLSAVEVLNSNRTKLGFAKWIDFYPENDVEKLYFIEVDYENKTANFYHKQSENFSSDKVVRTSGETTKLLKQIRVLLEDNSWFKHLKSENLEVTRKEIIEMVLNSNKDFQTIRREYL